MERKSSTGPVPKPHSEPARIEKIVGLRPSRRKPKIGKRRASLRRLLRRVVLGGVDCFAVLTSLYITASLIFAPSLAEQFFSSSVAAIFVGSAALVFYISGLYNRSWRFFGFGHAMMVVLVSLIANAIAWSATLTMLAKSPGIGFFAATLTHWLLTIALMMGARSLRRSVQEGLKPKTVAKSRWRSP